MRSTALSINSEVRPERQRVKLSVKLVPIKCHVSRSLCGGRRRNSATLRLGTRYRGNARSPSSRCKDIELVSTTAYFANRSLSLFFRVIMARQPRRDSEAAECSSLITEQLITIALHWMKDQVIRRSKRLSQALSSHSRMVLSRVPLPWRSSIKQSYTPSLL